MERTRLYVGDLAASVTEQELGDLFGQIGKVETIELITRPSQIPFAFIVMASPEMAQQGITQFNGYRLAGARLIVYAVPPRGSGPRNRS